MRNNNDIRLISQEDLALLGAPNVVYIRPVTTDPDKSDSYSGFGLFAANGQRLALTHSFDEAVGVALENNMAPVTVH